MAAAGLAFLGAWKAPRQVFAGTPGDAPMFMWYLRWIPYAITHGDNPLFSQFINYPDGVNLMWNTPMPLAGLVLTPITLLFGPVFSYNTLMTLGVALSGWCAYLMIRRYVSSTVAAVVGGLLYAFSPYMVAHAQAHPNLLTAFIPPLMFLVLDEILVRQGRPARRAGVILGLLTAAQLLLSEELLATEALVAGCGLVVLVVLHPHAVRSRARVTHAATALGVALVLCLGITAVPLMMQFWGAQSVDAGSEPLHRTDLYVTDLLAPVVPTSNQQFQPAAAEEVVRDFSDYCCPAEWNGYVGIPLLVLLAAVAIRWWSVPLVRFSACLLVVMVVLSFGSHLHLRGVAYSPRMPFWYISRLPVIGNILPGRLMLYVYLLSGLLMGVFVDRARARLSAPVVGVLVAVALLPLFPRLPFATTRAVTPAFFTSSAIRDTVPAGSVALVIPFARDTNTSEPMRWQAESGMRFKMPAAYALGPDQTGRFSFLPAASPLSKALEKVQTEEDPGPVNDEVRQVLLSELAADGVETVIVGPMRNRVGMVDFIRRLLGREPEEVGGVALWKYLAPVGTGDPPPDGP